MRMWPTPCPHPKKLASARFYRVILHPLESFSDGGLPPKSSSTGAFLGSCSSTRSSTISAPRDDVSGGWEETATWGSLATVYNTVAIGRRAQRQPWGGESGGGGRVRSLARETTAEQAAWNVSLNWDLLILGRPGMGGVSRRLITRPSFPLGLELPEQALLVRRVRGGFGHHGGNPGGWNLVTNFARRRYRPRLLPQALQHRQPARVPRRSAETGEPSNLLPGP